MKRNEQAFHETILDSIADGVFTVDKDWKVTSFNAAAERITGVPKKDALGRKCFEVFRANICESNCLLKQTLTTGTPCVNKTVRIINAGGASVPISVSTAILQTPSGKITGGVETFRDLSVIEDLRKEILGRHTFADIITKDHAMLKVFDVLPSMAKSDTTVLITGESGTGKELLARALHHLSHRSQGPFISVNCGALPDTLLESELFGYKKGAFTDAARDKPGRFHLAKGGTLFLDEIGDVSKALQVKLLRVLQEKRFEPLGATASETADVRVIAATNTNLPELVSQGKFRKDLFYRINVLSVELPPLRDRRCDIPLLADHFIEHFNNVYEKDIEGLSDHALAVLMNHDFPGNVRELQNIIEHAFIMCPAATIMPEHLPRQIAPSGSPAISGPGPVDVKEFERQHIQNALEQNRYSRQKTARQLGMHTATLWRKMKKLGIE
ncbi:MAG: PAS domain-containing protein [Chitinivibrionales bacterium]|nr:PAS domain-containing protein [Chitinivibrionales bacterium]MBD3396888.1 PAS domain-containing protein [Chitinivibrionales bacterium]